MLRSRPWLGATWATWPGRECRQRANLNRWEDNDERQKTADYLPPTGPRPIPSHPDLRRRLSHIEPVHPAGLRDLWDAPPVPVPPILTVAENRQTWTNFPTPTDPSRPTQPDPASGHFFLWHFRHSPTSQLAFRPKRHQPAGTGEGGDRNTRGRHLSQLPKAVRP